MNSYSGDMESVLKGNTKFFDQSQEKLHSGDGLKMKLKSKISSSGSGREHSDMDSMKVRKPECSLFISFVSLEHFVSCIEYSEMTGKQARDHFMEGNTKKIRGF